MTTRTRLLSLLAGLGLATQPGCASIDKPIKLRFTPKEDVTANLPVFGGVAPITPIAIAPLKDARQSADLLLVGENRQHPPPRAVRADSPIAEFATEVLKECFGKWGVPAGEGGYRLQGEITHLRVVEDGLYATQVNIRFQLEGQDGQVLWQGMAVGSAQQWGRSLSEENYNEQVSDALKRTYASLLSNPAFQQAWVGQAAPATGPKTLTPAAVKAAILKMMGQGIEAETIADYVRGVKIEPPLNPEELIDWKASGIPEVVLRAALAK